MPWSESHCARSTRSPVDGPDASAPLRVGPFFEDQLMKARAGITIDGVPRTYRDEKRIAIEGAEHLKPLNPSAEVAVRDYEGIEPSIVIKAQVPLVKAVISALARRIACTGIFCPQRK
jgi:hypothetical protein